MRRLQICAALAAAERVEFSVIQRHLGLSASALSKQVSALAEAGYVTQRRAYPDSRRVWLALTRAGRAAYHSHIAALRSVIDHPEPGGDAAR